MFFTGLNNFLFLKKECEFLCIWKGQWAVDDLFISATFKFIDKSIIMSSHKMLKLLKNKLKSYLSSNQYLLINEWNSAIQKGK